MDEVVEDLLDVLVAPDMSTGLGCDNMTCVIVDLENLKREHKLKLEIKERKEIHEEKLASLNDKDKKAYLK